MSDGRDVLIRQITDDLVDIITTHVRREMADASEKELAAFGAFVTKEREAAKQPKSETGGSDLRDAVTVPYTQLTLPTICRVYVSGVALYFKKKTTILR